VSEPYYSQHVRSVCVSLSAFFINFLFYCAGVYADLLLYRFFKLLPSFKCCFFEDCNEIINDSIISIHPGVHLKHQVNAV